MSGGYPAAVHHSSLRAHRPGSRLLPTPPPPYTRHNHHPPGPSAPVLDKTNRGHFFEDFETGQVLRHAVPRTLTEGDNALYIGLTGDRTPLHCDAEFARSLGLERETVNDL